jgi:hypothetical protein
MKLNKELTIYLSLAILCTSLTGCASQSVESLGGGYEEVTYTQPSVFMEQDAHRFSLQYRNQKSRLVMIWPETLGIIVTNDMAIFRAGKAYEPPYPDEPRATGWRLFAVKEPNLPLDITDEFLWRWAKQSDGDFAKLLKDPKLFKKVHIGNIDRTNSVLEFHTEILDVGNGIIRLDLNQIPDIMREVKEKGVAKKDRVWGTSYIEKEFKPEVQK